MVVELCQQGTSNKQRSNQQAVGLQQGTSTREEA